MEKNIGNEKDWAKKCLFDLNSDNLESKYITTYPDNSKSRSRIQIVKARSPLRAEFGTLCIKMRT